MAEQPAAGSPPGSDRPSSEDRGRRFLFGQCALDTRTLELSVGGAAVRLERKPLEVMLVLLSHAGEVVTKEELLDEVWQGRVLSESVLTKCMAKLRQALGDEAQALIRTVHGYGYRLVAEVQIERPTTDAVRALPELKAGDHPPQRPLWRLERPLGSGGFGEAWLVTHAKTGERRVFKFGVDATGIAALRREITLHRVLRQSLGARRDFVRVLDWNLEEPPCYLEIEYVSGGSLADWAMAQGGLERVPLATRLELVAQIAEALSAAHSVGVLHKDLKPGNVLIEQDREGQPQVQLADFGSGLLTDLARLEALEITRLGFTMVRPEESSAGTPLYLAPELLHGRAPTARSDVYALGVILYQMVVGDLRRALAVGWEQDVADPLLCEDIAAAASGNPEQRLGDAEAVARRLRELEHRRRERAREQAEREEARRLQLALEQSRTRRHRLWFASGVLTVVLSVVVVLLLKVRAAEEQTRYQAGVAAAVNEFLTGDLLAGANPMLSGRRDVTVRELLDEAAAGIDRRFRDSKGTEAAVRLALGSLYRNLGEYPHAERELTRALAQAGDDPRGLTTHANTRLELARLQVAQDRPTDAIATLEPLLDSPEPSIRLQARMIKGWALQHRGDYEEALHQLEALTPEVLAHYGEVSPNAAALLGYQAATMEKLGRYAEATERHRRELAVIESNFGAGHPQTLLALRGIGSSLFMVGHYNDAIEYTARAHAIALDALGPDHDETLRIASDLGLLHAEIGDYARGEEIMLATLKVRLAVFGEESRDTRTLLNNLGLFYGERGDHARETDYLERAYHAERAASGEHDPFTLVNAHNLARAMAKGGQVSDAEQLERRTLEKAREVFGEDHAYVAIMTYTHAHMLGLLGEYELAFTMFDEAITKLEELFDDDNVYTSRARGFRAEIETRARNAATARDVARSSAVGVEGTAQ
jgi:eukaryotic-like serine/threonine-protein kinase